ncbi:uncharacterized protein LOC134532637 isoform X2 [Bacillus rossius redtenbacheri]|uniref:uncharacterized protein LOC134532637 isoform X2 n=1 Tax=Bacillus rossius redtenbacheri TaxID=93214 RepID=UPI002FDE2804
MSGIEPNSKPLRVAVRILSMLCAQAGARKVYAVEASGIASVASRLVEANNLSHVVQVLQSKVEELELPEGEKVDAIVSEWMGFYLLHESMLDSVLVARDRFLAPGGKILPEMATLVACPCSLPRYHSHWREDFYGLDLSLFGELERSSRGTQPLVTDVHPEDLLAEPITIWQLDLQQAKCADLDCLRDRRVVLLNREGSFEGLCLWFECRFPGQGGVLSTGPAAPRTHWQQTALVLPSTHPVEAFECVAWELVLARSSDDTRHYNIQLSLLDPDTEPHPIPCDCIASRCALIGCVVEQYQKTHHN